MIKIICEGESVGAGNYIRVSSGHFKVKSLLTSVDNPTSRVGFNLYNFSLFTNSDYFVLRTPYGVSTINGGKFIFYLDGEFNCDTLNIIGASDAFGRVEIRNENGVLITDNGLPWNDGTYPPDAKNRAGLSGLHAAPAVINPELETVLMGDETNKERVQE